MSSGRRGARFGRHDGHHQAHWYPPAHLDSIAGRYRYETGGEPGAWRFEIRSRFWDIDEQLADMDAAGIDGVLLVSNVAGRPLAAPETWPIFGREQLEGPVRIPEADVEAIDGVLGQPLLHGLHDLLRRHRGCAELRGDHGELADREALLASEAEIVVLHAVVRERLEPQALPEAR